MPKQHQPRKQSKKEKKKKKNAEEDHDLGSRDPGRATQISFSPSLIWLFLFLLSGLPLSDLSLSLFWSGEAWNLEIFKIFLNYKSSL